MKLFIFLISFISVIAQAQEQSPGCQLDLYSVGKGETTPLQAEAEWILKIKGYNVAHREAAEFNVETMPALSMFASYRAGNDSFTGNADCIKEEFLNFGTRYTCSYELNLVSLDALGTPVLFAAVSSSIRMASSTSSFYESIREQLRVLPSCIW